MKLFLDNADRGANHANDALVAALRRRAREIQTLAASVTSNHRELVARLTAVSRNLDTISDHVSEQLREVSEQPGSGELSLQDLRRLGHRLVSLAGDLTTLGVDTARWADDLDET